MKGTEMIDAMADPGEEKQRRGVAAKLYFVGGEVMVLAHDSRDATMDVDGDSYPRDTVMEAAREIARLRDLPDEWLNAAANRNILAVKSPEWRPLLSLRLARGRGGRRPHHVGDEDSCEQRSTR